MIISDIILNRDCPEANITMSTGLTITDVIIYDLARYADLFPSDFNSTALILKTSADVMPYIIMLDHSTQKRNSDIMKLKTACQSIKTDTSLGLDNSEIEVQLQLNRVVLKALTTIKENKLSLASEPIVVCCYLPIAVNNQIALKTEVTDDIYCQITIPSNGFMSQLSIPDVATHAEVYIGIDGELVSKLRSTMVLCTLPLVVDYDDWHISDMDNHTVYDLGVKLE